MASWNLGVEEALGTLGPGMGIAPWSPQAILKKV